MPMSDYLANKLLDHAFRPGAPYTPPTTVYLQLDSTLYATDGTGGVALTGTTAARKAITNAASSSRQIATSAATSFTTDAPADWASNPPIKAFSVWDGLTSGNMLWTDLLTAQLTLAQHSVVNVAAGQELLQLPSS